eukprot:TRINITY_DN5883_c0_g1_i2.p1 TRINITY_DN5883_c0_g1~~TRINITY_DN5883_c0_g1_i2.p1  ORF type:complete len:3138 (+),score=1002.52 TRINITY_DN5883_c0_g1_i2:59-9415(+)
MVAEGACPAAVQPPATVIPPQLVLAGSAAGAPGAPDASAPSGALLAITTGDVVDLGEVLVSNKHEFSHVGLQNLTDVPLRVEMSSTVRTVGFQHSNENLRSADGGGTAPPPCSPSSDRHNFNQVFNYVNLIKTMAIPPVATSNVVISYRPTIPSSAGDTLDYRESGELVFHAFAEDGRSQVVKAKVTCRCCNSVLELSCTELDFGVISSTPTEQNTQIQEFTFRNESVIPVTLIMRLSRVSSALECTFTDPSTDDPTKSVLDTEVTLGPHDLKRIQVSVRAKPGACGDHDMQLSIENVLDQSSRNILLLASISSSDTTSKPPIDIGLPEGQQYLDFGNCYAGMPHTEQMTVTNSSLQTAWVAFERHSNDHRERLKGKLSLRLAERQAGQASSLPEIHDILIKPGQTQRLEVTYTPDLPADKRDKLVRKVFRLFARAVLVKEGAERPSEDDCASPHYSRGISCRAHVCTSRIEVKEKEIDFGDAPIGSTASCYVTIENPTQLPAELQVDYDSKIMKAVLNGNHVTIKANSAVSLEFQIVPHKVNPSFCKHVVLRNKRNPKDVNIINLSSNNIDSLASASVQYYSIVLLNSKTAKKREAAGDTAEKGAAADTGKDGMGLSEFGRSQHHPSRNGFSVEVAQGFPVLRAFKVKNKRSTPLTLNMSASKQDCIQLYYERSRDVPATCESLLQEFTGGWLEILPERDHREEVAYVERVLELKNALHRAIHETQSITPLNTLTLPPEGEPDSEAVIYVLCTVPSTYDGDSLKRRGTLEEHITISIDQANENEPRGERIINVTIQLGAAGLELGQKNFNLGHVVVGERKSRTIQISNTSSVFPLLFAVTKDNASLDSTQLRIEGTKDHKYVGLVRPFARRPLELQFHPSMRGKFDEKLTFSNLLDPSVTKTMTIKAQVCRVATFEIKPTSVDAGIAFVGDAALLKTPRQNNTVKAKLTLINTGKTKRDYLIGPSSGTPLKTECLEMRPEFEVEAIKSQASSQNIEEEIEALEQKIKGLMRKKKEDKVVRARAKLNRLRAIQAGEQSGDHDTSDVSSSEDEGMRVDNRRGQSGEDRAPPNCTYTKAVSPGRTVSIAITIHLKKLDPAAVIDDVVCNLDVVISEARDKESQKTVKIQFKASGNPSLFAPPEESSPVCTHAVTPTTRVARSPSPVLHGGALLPLKDEPRPLGKSKGPLPRGGKEDASPEHRSAFTSLGRRLTPDTDGLLLTPPHPAASSPVSEQPAGVLHSSTSAIDFGKLRIGESASQTLDLSAFSGPVGYVILQNRRVGGSDQNKGQDAKIDITPRNGTIVPGKSERVTITVTPHTSQLQKYIMEIRNLHDKNAATTPVTLTVCGTMHTPVAITPAQINFENIYLGVETAAQVQDRHTAVHKHSQVVLRNESAEPQAVVVGSTHPAQCAIYRTIRDHDAVPDNEVKKVTLQPNESLPLYVRLYPRLSRTKARDGHSRSMRGAVVFSSDTGSWRRSVPFTCVIGCVELEVSGNSVIDLGTRSSRAPASHAAEARGTFMLINRNASLSLEYRVLVSNEILHVDSVEGVIPPKGSVELRYSLQPPAMKFGLFQESIEIRNTTSNQLPIKKTLLLFVDPGLVKVELFESSARNGIVSLPVMPVRKTKPTSAGTPAGGHLAPSLGPNLSPVDPTLSTSVSGASVLGTSQGRDLRQGSLGPACLATDQWGPRDLAFANLSQGRVHVKLRNTANVDLYVVPKCDVHGFADGVHYASSLFVHSGRADRTRLPHSHSAAMKGLVWSSAGSCFLLPKFKTALIAIEPSCVPVTLGEEARTAMAMNRAVTVRCLLSFVIEQADTSAFHSNYGAAKPSMLSMGSVVQMLKVDMNICRPTLAFEAPELCMGKVRSDEKIPLNIEVRNPSQVKVPVELSLPPNMVCERCPAPGTRCSFPAFVEPFSLTELAHPLDVGRSSAYDGRMASPGSGSGVQPFSRHTVAGAPDRGTPPLSLPSPLMTPPKLDDRCCIGLLKATLPETLTGDAAAADADAQEAPSGTLHGFFTTVIPSESLLRIHALLVPPVAAKDQGKLSAQVLLRNLLDGEEQTMHVEGEIERNIWAYQVKEHTNSAQLLRDNEGLVLDSTVRVSRECKSADVKVFLRCTEAFADSEASINAAVVLQPDQEFAQFLNFKLLLLATNLEVDSGLSFTREDTYVGLRVRCAALPGTCISKPVAELLWKAMYDDAVSRAEMKKIKGSTEVHIHDHAIDAHWAPRQNTDTLESSVDAYDDAKGDGAVGPCAAEPLLSFPVVTLLQASPIATSLPLGMLCVTAPGYADHCKDVYGVLQQEPTFEVAKNITLFANPPPHASPDAPSTGPMYTATLTLAYPHSVGRDELHVRIRAVTEYGHEIATELDQFATIPVGKAAEVTVRARLSAAMPPQQLKDVMLIFVQDVACPLSFQVVKVAFAYRALLASPSEEDDVLPSSLSSSLASMGKTMSANGQGMAAAAKSQVDGSPNPNIALVPRPLDSPDFKQAEAEKAAEKAAGTTSPGIKDMRKFKDSRVGDELLAGGENAGAPEAPILGPVVRLHNCKQAESGTECRQYDVSFAPGVLDEEPPTVTITAENTSSRTIEVSVDTAAMPGDVPLVTSSSRTLQIKPNSRASVVLSATVTTVGLHTAYVLFEFGSDVIALKCSCEVLASGRRATALFDVLIDGAPSVGSFAALDVGEVFYEQVVAHRSLDIVNNSDARLEFNVAHVPGSSEAHDAQVAVDFSLEMAGGKQEPRAALQRLAVGPYQTQRVFLSCKVTRNAEAASGHGTPRADRTTKVADVTSELQVKCRWAKDLSKTILVKAKALPRAFTVLPTLLTLSRQDSADARPRTVTVKNICTVPISVSVRTAMYGFVVTSDAQKGSESRRASAPARGDSLEPRPRSSEPQPFGNHTTLHIPANHSATLHVALHDARLASLAPSTQGRPHALHEHFFVYNRANAKEHCVVRLHCALNGGVETALSLKNVIHPVNPASELRDQVFLFLRQFKRFALTDVPHGGKDARQDDEEVDDDAKSLDLDAKSGDESNDSHSREGVRNETATVAHAAALLRGAHEYLLQLRWLVDELVYQKVTGVRGQHLVLAKLLFFAVTKNWLVASACKEADPWHEVVAHFNTFRYSPV